MAEDYWVTLHDDPFAKARLKRSCELLNCAHHHSVLDVGCHKSEALEFLPKHIDYTGVDSLLGDDFDGGLKLFFQFNRILCLEVLEHLKYPHKTLQSLVDLLKDDGIMVISLPNENTLFHRLRSLCGCVDAECFSENGKHLHLPNLRQASEFVSKYLKIQKVEYYTSSGISTRQVLIHKFLKLIPKGMLRFLASLCPSLFARGFIFVCVKRS